MRRRPPETDASVLPAELAAGPLPELWASPDEECPRWMRDEEGLRQWRRSTAGRAWLNACEDWWRANGRPVGGWRPLLPEDVRYATSAKGRHHWPDWPDK